MTFPEVSFEVYLKYLQSCQSFAEQSRLPKGNIELAYIRSTRGDGVTGLRGTLCRGEFYECILRCAYAWAQYPKMLSDHLEEFFEIYVETKFQKSQIIPLRKIIRASGPLNQLLHDNTAGLKMLYSECSERNNRFTYESARKFFNTISEQKGADLVVDLRQCFVHCQMTNLKDLE